VSNNIRRIMVADNHELIRLGIRSWLEVRPNQLVVAEASDGRMALAEALATKPNIAIISDTLSELNCVDLTYALKRELPDVEVLIFATHDRDDVAADALRAGAKGYVRKSDRHQEFLEAIDALSSHRPYYSGGMGEEALERLRDGTAVDGSALTRREREIVQLIGEGHINKQIAYVLAISIKTVETHRATVMQKLKVGNTAQLVRYALRNHIVQAQ